MEQISPIKKRILQFIEYKGIAKTEFCEKTSQIHSIAIVVGVIRLE